MMNSKYLFIHFPLLVLFLTFPLSSAHPKGDPVPDIPPPTDNNKCQCPNQCPCPPPPQNNNNNPSLPRPPGDSNNPPQPPSNSNNPPQPPSDSNNPGPPGDSNKPPQPPSDSNNPGPPGDSNKPPQPPIDSNNAGPPGDSNKPPQPPSDSNNPGDSNKPPQPPSDGDKPPQPPSDDDNPNPTMPGKDGFAGCFDKIFAFGDSFTDTGNAYAMGGLQSFVGSLISNLPGHRYLNGHRQCDGRLVVDFLCEKLGVPHLPPYKQASSNFSSGANFAVAGSTAFPHKYLAKFLRHKLMWNGNPTDFLVQVDWFKKFMSQVACKGMDEGACKALAGKALFWIGEIGGSDYARTFGFPLSHKLLTDLTIGHVSKIVNSLLEYGAKYIVVQGLPPLGCCPLEMFISKVSDRDQMGCASICNSLIQAHNQLLQTMIQGWQKKFPDCIIAYADYWNAYKTILANHRKYNFDDPFKACCGAGGPLNFNLHSLCGSIGTSACKDPSRHMHWDGFHLTEAMYKHITDLFLNGGFCKPSFAKLVKKKLGH